MSPIINSTTADMIAEARVEQKTAHRAVVNGTYDEQCRDERIINRQHEIMASHDELYDLFQNVWSDTLIEEQFFRSLSDIAAASGIQKTRAAYELSNFIEDLALKQAEQDI